MPEISKQTLDFIKNKNVLIIGSPASGKTFLTERINSKTHKVIHTDDYKEYGYKNSLYKILEDLKNIKQPTLIEGVQGYRLLRKGVELNCYYPDVVIELSVPKDTLLKAYKLFREPKNIEIIEAFNNMNQGILNEYRKLNNKKKPHWIQINNDYA